MRSYDIITVGGGLGGSALAKVMAERGARVLVVEREAHFKDRVRGEALAPWGVENLKQLGLYDTLSRSCGNILRWWSLCVGGVEVLRRDLPATTPQSNGFLTFYHPRMQELALEAAVSAGAEVRRGAHVRHVEPGRPPRVTIVQAGKEEEASARLVVAADGRGSTVRRWAGFALRQDPLRLLFCGVLFDDLAVASDTFHHFAAPPLGLVGYFFPQGNGRVRAYYGFHKDRRIERLQGASAIPRFRESLVVTGAPAEMLAQAKPAGPLATFDGADSWVDHPYRDGVALIGDAAATSDPTWGQGMSLTTRDVRVLRDCLLAESDWDAAGHAYAAEHDRYYGICHRVDGWFAELFMELGPEADARRARALPLIAQDPLRVADCPMSGPEAPSDDAVRARFFGEV